MPITSASANSPLLLGFNTLHARNAFMHYEINSWIPRQGSLRDWQGMHKSQKCVNGLAEVALCYLLNYKMALWVPLPHLNWKHSMHRISYKVVHAFRILTYYNSFQASHGCMLQAFRSSAESVESCLHEPSECTNKCAETQHTK